jgi:hypothetical protein
MFSERIVGTVLLFVEELVEVLVEDAVELVFPVEEELAGELEEFAELAAVLVGLKVSLPTPKPVFDA